jgi:hypothetical protein
MYVNVKMRLVENIPEIRVWDIKENDRRVNSSMMYLKYYKKFCKCQHKNKKKRQKRKSRPVLLSHRFL